MAKLSGETVLHKNRQEQHTWELAKQCLKRMGSKFGQRANFGTTTGFEIHFKKKFNNFNVSVRVCVCVIWCRQLRVCLVMQSSNNWIYNRICNKIGDVSNVVLSRVRVTIVAYENPEELYIMTVCLILNMHHAKRRRHIILSSVGRQYLQYSFHIIS
jgi:hypothetical protein